MSTVMVVMIIVMVVGFLGFGHHRGMMGGHDKEKQKEESVVHEHTGKASCPDCPVEPELEKGDGIKEIEEGR